MLDNQHECFSPPEENCTLWRYMDFTKLLSLLENQQLHFCRADQFDDPYEGALSKSSVQLLKNPDTNGGIPEEAANKYISHSNFMRTQMYMSCWFASEHESDAMWKIYLQSSEGISIRTDHDSLCAALENSKLKIRTTLVKYVDYDRTLIPLGNLFFPFVHKRLSFSHENELRAIIWSLEDVNKSQIQDKALSVCIDIDPKTLIKEIHVSPMSPKWFGDLIEKVVDRYGLKCPIKHSNLYAQPVY